MRIKSKAGQSIAAQLTDIVQMALPQCVHSGIASHLGNVKADPKGKAVLFTWKKNIYGFRITENLKVSEMDFTGTFTTTDESKNVEKMIAESLAPATPVVVNVEQEKTEVKEAATEEVVAEEIAPTPA